MSQPPSFSGPRRTRRHPRLDYRSRSHDSAHASGGADPAEIPVHPLIPRNLADVIVTPQGLTELVARLRAAGSFAYDSEFIGELSYHPKLCLIQVATSERVSLIDTLAELDLSEFWALIADDAVEKIVHAGQQDLEPVYRLSGKPPANIFDVQVAAGFTGLSYPCGLSKLVKELVGVRLGKGFTFTHWDRRPLSAVQLSYAADDVRYLPALRQIIGRRLEQLGHLQWAKQECATLCDVAQASADPAAALLRIRGAASLSPQGVAILRELARWREQAARRCDTPPRSFLKDEILVDLAKTPVKEVGGLARVRGLPRPVEHQEGSAIVEATRKGLATPAADLPVMEKPEECAGERFTVDSLWSAVQAWCYGNAIDPTLATSRQEVARFYREIRHSGGESGELRLSAGWRNELLGSMLREFLAGGRSFAMRWDGALRAE